VAGTLPVPVSVVLPIVVDVPRPETEVTFAAVEVLATDVNRNVIDPL
jgi:hypothetical protein